MREVTTREGAQIQIKIDYPFRTFAKECLGEVLGKFIDFFTFLVMKKPFIFVISELSTLGTTLKIHLMIYNKHF